MLQNTGPITSSSAVSGWSLFILVMTQNTSAMSGMVAITSSSVSRVSLALDLTLSDNSLVSSRSMSSA